MYGLKGIHKSCRLFKSYCDICGSLHNKPYTIRKLLELQEFQELKIIETNHHITQISHGNAQFNSNQPPWSSHELKLVMKMSNLAQTSHHGIYSSSNQPWKCPI
jgi:hypothetical protein